MDNQESAPSGKDRFVTRKAVGERITFLREARGLSQKALSDELAKLGLVVRRETITQWENGTRDLKTEYLAKLSEKELLLLRMSWGCHTKRSMPCEVYRKKK